MASLQNGSSASHEEAKTYHLPHDTPEHERLDKQAVASIALMDDKAFHTEPTEPKRILDIGCGTGAFTQLLAKQYPQAQVIGVDLAPVPESRHGRLPNVAYIQGDIRDLIGKDPRFQLASFSYIFQRALVAGISRWSEHIASISRLLERGGTLELQEMSQAIWRANNERIEDDMDWYAAFKADAEASGLDIEIGDHLKAICQSTPTLHDVREWKYPFSPTPDPERPDLNDLVTQIPRTLPVVLRSICGPRRSEVEVETIVRQMQQRFEKGFGEGAHFNKYAVVSMKKDDV